MNTNSNKEINYPEKILNFHAITEYHDEEQALKFLEKANWDEGVIYIITLITLI